VTGRQVAVLTGAAQGIGRATAAALSREGFTVVLLDVDAREGAATAGRLAETGADARFIPADVSDGAAVSQAMQDIVRNYGRLDFVFANAGIEHCASILDTTDEQWQRVISVNLGGVFYTCREALRAMLACGSRGSMVMTASPHAWVTGKEIGAYAASKGGVVAFMHAMALEAADYGIRVNAVVPGAIDTPMLHREAQAAGDPEAQFAALSAIHPIGRLGTAEEIADAVVFLASTRARFITGSCLVVDGGLMAAQFTGNTLSYSGMNGARGRTTERSR
jgi:NAD(P)-dependent dehydrogenase (short-subunit alcohol dehydrogenase family)